MRALANAAIAFQGFIEAQDFIHAGIAELTGHEFVVPARFNFRCFTYFRYG